MPLVMPLFCSSPPEIIHEIVQWTISCMISCMILQCWAIGLIMSSIRAYVVYHCGLTSTTHKNRCVARVKLIAREQPASFHVVKVHLQSTPVYVTDSHAHTRKEALPIDWSRHASNGVSCLSDLFCLINSGEAVV